MRWPVLGIEEHFWSDGRVHLTGNARLTGTSTTDESVTLWPVHSDTNNCPMLSGCTKQCYPTVMQRHQRQGQKMIRFALPISLHVTRALNIEQITRLAAHNAMSN